VGGEACEKGGRMMIDLTYFISIIVISLIVGQAAFMILRYFVLKRQSCYEGELEFLNKQLKNNKISKPLFSQEKLRLRKKYKPEFYEKWWGQKSK
jgi:hypothetical protein